MSALEDIDDAEQFDAQAMDDSFVLQAAEWDGVAVEPGQDEDEADDLEEVSSGDESDEEEDGIRGYPGYKGDGVSLASSYWRKERSDRNEQLALIDERFERLAFQYDEDQIGDLDDKDNEEITGALAISHFDSILDEFIEKNVRCTEVVLADPSLCPDHVFIPITQKSIIPGGSGDVEADEEAEARRLTKANAHELASDCSEEAGSALVDHAIEEAFAEKQQAERWDCESVLSLRSNLDNHPGRISEPAVRKASKSEEPWCRESHFLPLSFDLKSWSPKCPFCFAFAKLTRKRSSCRAKQVCRSPGRLKRHPPRSRMNTSAWPQRFAGKMNPRTRKELVKLQ